MCKKAKAGAQVLKDRTQGLDSRGNRAMNTQAESNWATEALKGLENDPEAVQLITDELKRVYDESKKLKAPWNKYMTSSFKNGFEDYFGEYKEDSKTKQLKRVKPPKAEATPTDLINLMLESKYDFKMAVDRLADLEKETDVGRPLATQGRDVDEFRDRGRKEGRKRRNSFVGPHAGIADHVFRPEGSDNFFTREVTHAKGTLEGDPNSQTYQRFVQQGAPFIGGVSGTIQNVNMCWEAKQKLSDIQDDDERDAERTRREKTTGIYMATLLAGGHHSMAEMLFAAKRHDLFPDIPNPLDDYPGAMKALGARFEELGLPKNLMPEAGATWRKALAKARDEIIGVGAEMITVLEKYGYDDGVITSVGATFNRKFLKDFNDTFTDELAHKLDEIVSLAGGDGDDDDGSSSEDDDDGGGGGNARDRAKREAADLIKDARDALNDEIIEGLEGNPFVPVSVRKTLSSALDQVSSLTR